MWHSKQDFPGGYWYWHVPVHNLLIRLGFTNTFYYGMASTVLHQHGSPGANATCERICREVLTGLAAILVELSQNPATQMVPKSSWNSWVFIPTPTVTMFDSNKLWNDLILGQSQRFGDPIVTSPQSNTTPVVSDSKPSRIKSILGFVIFKVFRSCQALAASSDRKSWCLGDVWVLSSGKAQNRPVLVDGSLVGLPQYPHLLRDPPVNQQEKCGKPSIMGTIWLSKLD